MNQCHKTYVNVPSGEMSVSLSGFNWKFAESISLENAKDYEIARHNQHSNRTTLLLNLIMLPNKFRSRVLNQEPSHIFEYALAPAYTPFRKDMSTNSDTMHIRILVI